MTDTTVESKSATRARSLDQVADRAKHLVRRLIGPTETAQGRHVDPADSAPVDRDGWAAETHELMASPEMAAFGDVLRPPGGGDIRAGVLQDLSGFYDLDEAECIRRALGWEELSVEEWQAKDRSSPDDLREFYRTTQSWGFDLLWYAYLQTAGHGIPMSVLVARFLETSDVRPGRHLDFGSGAGVTSQLFASLGYQVDLADVSDPLLELARYRLERRGTPAGYLNLNSDLLPTDAYDVVTAFDVLAHVPDLPATLGALRASMRPDGWLLATFDARPQAPESAWHLYDEEWELCWQTERAGFVQVDRIGTIRCYRPIDRTTPAGRLSLVGAAVRHRTPVLLALRRAGRSAELRYRSRRG